MALRLSSIKTLQDGYKAGVLKVATSPKHSHKPTLLDRVSVWQGDITRLELDSIVNAANGHLGDGAGVNGAIQRAAGSKLLDECDTLGGCETGSAKITNGYRLPAKHVIHAVGPIYSRRDVEHKAAQLRSCYKTSLEIAVQNNLNHIAFPSLSTGIYGYPIDDATHIALDATRVFLDTPEGDKLDRVIFVVWSDKDRDVYRDLIPYYFPGPQEEEPVQDQPVQEQSIQEQPVQDQSPPDQPQDQQTGNQPPQGQPPQDQTPQDLQAEHEPAQDQPTQEKRSSGET